MHFGIDVLCIVLLDCVTSDAILILRVIISLCMFVLFFSAVAFLMDIFGPTHVVCRAIRFTASLPILSGTATINSSFICLFMLFQ